MPAVAIHVMKGVFTPEQKSATIAKVTDAMVAVEGENLRGVTWVKINEVEGRDRAIGGQPLQARDGQKMAAGSGGQPILQPACVLPSAAMGGAVPGRHPAAHLWASRPTARFIPPWRRPVIGGSGFQPYARWDRAGIPAPTVEPGANGRDSARTVRTRVEKGRAPRRHRSPGN